MSRHLRPWTLQPADPGYEGAAEATGRSLDAAPTHNTEHTANGRQRDPKRDSTAGDASVAPTKNPDSDPALPPVAHMPPVLRDGVRAVAAHVQCPLGIAFSAVLAEASLVTQGLCDVEVYPHLPPRPLSLFLITLARSGDRKSTADRVALRPVYEHLDHLHAKHRRALTRHHAQAEAHDARRKSTKARLKGNPDDLAAALEALGPKPTPPALPKLTYDDPTLEGLHIEAEHGYPSFGIFNAEGGQWIAGHAMNKDNRLKTLAGLSKYWDADPVERTRADSETCFYIKGRRCCMHLQVQPGVGADLVHDAQAAEQGFLGRCLIAAPPSIMGSRDVGRMPTAAEDAALTNFYDAMRRILAARLPLRDDDPAVLAPRRLRMSDDASKLFLFAAQHIEQQTGAGGEFDNALSGFGNKLAEQIARIAGVYALCNQVDADTPPDEVTAITREEMQWAVLAGRYFMTEATRVFATAGTSDADRNVQALVEWIDSRPEDRLSLRLIKQYGPRRFRGKQNEAALRDTIDALIARGAVEAMGPGRIVWQTPPGQADQVFDAHDVYRIVPRDVRES